MFFRAATANEARRLGIRGHAVNLADGRVEVLAIGTGPALAELRSWLQRGPSAARVDLVSEEPVPVELARTLMEFRTG